MFINILKSIQKFAYSSRKYKDLETVTSHCIDKLKLFVGLEILRNSEINHSNIELDASLDLKDYLDRPTDVEIRSILTFVEKRKNGELDFKEYDGYLDIIYPYIVSPIYKSCKQYTNQKLITIALDGIQKLVSCERFRSISVDISTFYGCSELVLQNNNIMNGLEFLTKLLVELYENVEDDSTKIHTIKVLLLIIEININYFDCIIFYSIILTLFNIYSNTIDTGVKNSSSSVLIQIIEFFFNRSLEQNNEYIEKYFMLLIETIYTLSMTNDISSINKHANSREIERLKLIIPLEMKVESCKFIEIENNFFKFAHNNIDLDQKVCKIRSIGLEALILVYKRYFGSVSCENNTYISKCINKVKHVHMFCILKNTILNDSNIRINSLKLWSLSNHIDNLINFHGIYISKCIIGLFDCNLVELPEKLTIINILFNKLVDNEILFSFLFREYDLNLNNENLILKLFNLLTNILIEDISNKTNTKALQEVAFKLMIRILLVLKNILSQFNNIKSVNNDDNIILMKKYLMNEYLNDFNNGEYNKSIELLFDSGILEDKSELTIAKLLISNKYISKVAVGDYLSLPNKVNSDVLKEYCNLFSFKGHSLDYSLYIFLSNFHLPGEAQKIDRIIEQFSIKYYNDNLDLFPNKDSVYIIAFSLMILHTDAHNKEIKNDHRMTKNDFIRNNNELLVSSNYPIDFLEIYYDNITLNEWIFEYYRDQAVVVFPFFEYFINYINNIDITSRDNGNGEFQIKILSHKLYKKIINLLINNNDKENNNLLSKIYGKIKERYETLYFSNELTQELIYWKIIPNSSNQSINDNLLKKKISLNNENGQLNNSGVYYDGIKFNKILKSSQSSNTLQPSNSINQNTNTKWSSTMKVTDSKNRDINSIYQTCITNIIISVINGNNNELNENNSNYILLSKTLCSYITEMISNIDFWIYINKDFLINWITIIKLIIEISIILNMEPCYTINMVILSYLTNIVTLPINYNDLFFSDIDINNDLFINNYCDDKKMSDNFPRNLFFSEFDSNICSNNIETKDFKLIANALKTHLHIMNKIDVKRHNSSDQTGANLLSIINSENYTSQLLLSDPNIFAIKCILDVTNSYGDRFTCLFWLIAIEIISQIDRYYYIKTLQKSNEYGNIDNFDLNKMILNQGKDIKEVIDFLNISKIRNSNIKEQYNNSTYIQSTKSIRSIFSITKNTISNSQFENTNNNNNKEFADNIPIADSKSSQIIKSYIYLRNSICHNNLWCNEVKSENQIVLEDENILWVDNEIYSYLQSQFSVSSLRKIEKYNSEIIIGNFSIYEKIENIFALNILNKGNKYLIRDFFMGLLFNAINQVLYSFKKVTGLFLFHDIFEIMGLLIDSGYHNSFYEVILWDDYFIPYFYSKTIQLLDNNSLKIVLNLVRDFIIKLLNSSNNFIRNNTYDKSNNKNKIVFVSRENSLKNTLTQNNIFLCINLDNNVNNRSYSCFYLFKYVLDNVLAKNSVNASISLIELMVDILSKMITQCDSIMYYNTMDFKDILDIYNNISYIILRNTDGCLDKDEVVLNNEMDIFSNITASIISINDFVFILDINLSIVMVNTLINILKLSIGRNNRLVSDINDYLIYIFYLMIKNTYDAEVKVLIQERNVVNNYLLSNKDDCGNRCFNSEIHKVFTGCLREYLLFVTRSYVIENNYIDLYYYNLTNISKIMHYWLKISLKSKLIEDTLFVYNLIYELFNSISLCSSINIKECDGHNRKYSCLINKLANNYSNSENNYGFKQNSINNNIIDGKNEDLEDEYDEEECDEEDDFENYFVDDETDINFIQHTNYNSIGTDKSNFEVTNKKHQLYNSQLTLTNTDDMEEKNSYNSRNTFSLLENKIEEMNKVLNTEDCKNQLITDEILESGFYLKMGNIDFEKKKAPKVITTKYNIYKILEYYILCLNINVVKSLFKDWLNINNKIILLNNINMFNREDIRIQFKLFIVYFRLIDKNRKLFGYDEWKLIIESFSELIMRFTNNILESERMYFVTEDVDNNNVKDGTDNNYETRRSSIDDLLVNYRGEKFSEGSKNSEVDDYYYTKKRSNIESFFKSVFFQRKKYYSDSKRIKNYDDSDINMLKKRNVEKRLANLRVLLKKNWRCYSHKHIKNTYDQDMYNSYNKLRENIEELINTSIKEGVQEYSFGNDSSNILNKPYCIQDLYSTVLVMYKLLVNWFFIDLKNINGNSNSSCDSDNDFHQEIYKVITKSLGFLNSTLAKKLNFVKYDLYQYNLYLIQTIQLYTIMGFLNYVGDTQEFYVNSLVDYIKYINSEYMSLEDRSRKYSSISKYDIMVNDKNNNYVSNDKIVNSNHYYFNSCYDLLLYNKIELKNIYYVSLFNLLNTNILPKFVIDKPIFQRTLLDLTLVGNKQLEMLSKHIITRCYDGDDTTSNTYSNSNSALEIKTELKKNENSGNCDYNNSNSSVVNSFNISADIHSNENNGNERRKYMK
ncbi:large Sec7 domain containing [Cryptosporidium xiaoi]|uniref:Large Sec7 domain containing n=1 Tax=Cryptosporidium xiaoi TaxID=659607 RepID=A0AAV9Y388_9CRYT